MTAITVRRSPSQALTVVEPFFSHTHMGLLDEVENLARSMWESWTPVVYRTDLSGRLDMYEEKDELVMRVEFPGIRKDDIDISLEGDTLNIKAEKKQEEISDEATFYKCERSFGQYFRSVSLPFPVNEDNISAMFSDGILEIRLPKAEEAKSKHIDIKVK